MIRSTEERTYDDSKYKIRRYIPQHTIKKAL